MICVVNLPVMEIVLKRILMVKKWQLVVVSNFMLMQTTLNPFALLMKNPFAQNPLCHAVVYGVHLQLVFCHFTLVEDPNILCNILDKDIYVIKNTCTVYF